MAARPQARLDRAVDESRPPVGDVRAGEQHAALGPLDRAMVMLVPAGPVNRPRAARKLVAEPVVRGGVDHLLAGQDRVEMVLHRGQVAGVAPRRVGSEADHQLRAVAVDRLGAEIAERMRRAGRVLVQRLAARAAKPDPSRVSTSTRPLR